MYRAFALHGRTPPVHIRVPRFMNRSLAVAVPLVSAFALSGIASVQAASRVDRLVELLEQNSLTGSHEDFILPDSDDLAAIPQDLDTNPLTPEKIALGRLLFHETAVGTATSAPDRVETYACASCHHAAAGFKSGIAQGLGDGGSGFGRDGSRRRLARGLDPNAGDTDPAKPDFQPVTSPTVLNSAYQDVMLWNGALGSRPGSVNIDEITLENKKPDFGPLDAKVNQFGLPGLETQVLAGTRVHRLSFDDGSILTEHPDYARMYAAAFPDGPDESLIPPGSLVSAEALGAALAIAAYERTVLANRAPFQRWLRGDRGALRGRELAGAELFFGKAGCVRCHTGPALSSWPDAKEGELFFAVGFADLDTRRRDILGTVGDVDSRGRGGFTDTPADDFKFKVPPLYNLADTRVFGHGASFRSVRDVIRYKNAGIVDPGDAQNGHGTNAIDPTGLTAPLGLTGREIGDLTRFVERSLHDPDLERYVPDSLPSGNCFPVADFRAATELRCF